MTDLSHPSGPPTIPPDSPTEPPTEPTERPPFLSADPRREERWERAAYHDREELATEINQMREQCREAIALVNAELPREIAVNWPQTESEIRGQLVLEHVLPDGSPERLLYELHVMREFKVFTDSAVAQAEQLAERRRAAEARQALLNGVGPMADPAFRAIAPQGGRPVRERPSHFGG